MSVQAVVPAPPTSAPALTAEAMRAAQVMMRKSPETQRTYRGIYGRFAGWLADRDSVAEAGVDAFTSEALIEYLEQLEARCSPSTVKKERAALRKLARYLHQLQLLDATVILMIEIPTVERPRPRPPRPRPRQLEASPHRRARPSDPDRSGALLTSGSRPGPRADPDASVAPGCGLRRRARSRPIRLTRGALITVAAGCISAFRARAARSGRYRCSPTWSTHSSCGASSATGSGTGR